MLKNKIQAITWTNCNLDSYSNASKLFGRPFYLKAIVSPHKQCIKEFDSGYNDFCKNLALLILLGFRENIVLSPFRLRAPKIAVKIMVILCWKILRINFFLKTLNKNFVCFGHLANRDNKVWEPLEWTHNTVIMWNIFPPLSVILFNRWQLRSIQVLRT